MFWYIVLFINFIFFLKISLQGPSRPLHSLDRSFSAADHPGASPHYHSVASPGRSPEPNHLFSGCYVFLCSLSRFGGDVLLSFWKRKHRKYTLRGCKCENIALPSHWVDNVTGYRNLGLNHLSSEFWRHCLITLELLVLPVESPMPFWFQILSMWHACCLWKLLNLPFISGVLAFHNVMLWTSLFAFCGIS